MVKILKVEDVSPLEAEIDRLRELIEKNFAAPGTSGEERADSPHQRAQRELIARKRYLEREQITLYSVFHAYGTSRVRQLEVSARLDEIEAELASLRPDLAAKTQRVAKSDIGIGLPKVRDALGVLLRTPDLKKSDHPDPLELDNSLGVRSQPKIK